MLSKGTANSVSLSRRAWDQGCVNPGGLVVANVSQARRVSGDQRRPEGTKGAMLKVCEHEAGALSATEPFVNVLPHASPNWKLSLAMLSSHRKAPVQALTETGRAPTTCVVPSDRLAKCSSITPNTPSGKHVWGGVRSGRVTNMGSSKFGSCKALENLQHSIFIGSIFFLIRLSGRPEENVVAVSLRGLALVAGLD